MPQSVEVLSRVGTACMGRDVRPKCGGVCHGSVADASVDAAGRGLERIGGSAGGVGGVRVLAQSSLAAWLSSFGRLFAARLPAPAAVGLRGRPMGDSIRAHV